MSTIAGQDTETRNKKERRMMWLLIDIGNTQIAFGISKGKGICKAWDLPTKILDKPSRLSSILKLKVGKNALRKRSISKVIICSVVPPIEKKMKAELKKIFPQGKILCLGKDIPVPIKNNYKYPAQVGKDRLANATCAKYYYKAAAIIVDFGTAITIDAITKKGEYLGGVIVPGINMSLAALHEKTALLPLVSLQKPREILGRDTKSSILSGILYGFAFLVDGLIETFKKKIKAKTIVIATGGNLGLMKSLCRKIDVYDPQLTLKGIEMAYRYTKLKK